MAATALDYFALYLAHLGRGDVRGARTMWEFGFELYARRALEG